MRLSTRADFRASELSLAEVGVAKAQVFNASYSSVFLAQLLSVSATKPRLRNRNMSTFSLGGTISMRLFASPLGKAL